jgi:methylenetetrahydrofolate dehydrogenase (NADP+)/methenyltetrahydrofolate cyclohydrolase
MPEHFTSIDGTAVAARRLRELAERLNGATPGLGILVATENPATATYVERKQRQAAEVGITARAHHLTPDSTQAEIIAACQRLNQDAAVAGYIVQRPLPEGVDVDTVLAAVAPEKDADGLTPRNLERLYAGEPAVIPATPKGILTLLEAYEIPINGRTVTVVGQGRLTGKPLAALLEQQGATVIRCDKSTADLGAETRKGDIVVVATGQPGLLTAEMVKDGVVVVDVGISRLAGKTVGDVDYEGVSRKAAAITPVPGGVGPMTVVSLLENVAELAHNHQGY